LRSFSAISALQAFCAHAREKPLTAEFAEKYLAEIAEKISCWEQASLPLTSKLQTAVRRSIYNAGKSYADGGVPCAVFATLVLVLY